MDKKDYFLIKTHEASPTSVDKLFDAAPVVDEVCALLDRVLGGQVCLLVAGGVPLGPPAHPSPAGSPTVAATHEAPEAPRSLHSEQHQPAAKDYAGQPAVTTTLHSGGKKSTLKKQTTN